MRNQQGIALVTSILLLLILTLVAVSLASRTRTTTQMATASVAREEAMHEVNGVQEAYVEQQRLARADNKFVTEQNSSVDGNNTLTFLHESSCRRSRNATASGLLACRQTELRSEIQFGRNDRGSMAVVAGVEQPVLMNSGG